LNHQPCHIYRKVSVKCLQWFTCQSYHANRKCSITSVCNGPTTYLCSHLRQMPCCMMLECRENVKHLVSLLHEMSQPNNASCSYTSQAYMNEASASIMTRVRCLSRWPYPSSNRTWSLPLPVAPCETASAPTACAISIWRLAMRGRAMEVPSRYTPSYKAFALQH
jgi:hypothetical protein